MTKPKTKLDSGFETQSLLHSSPETVALAGYSVLSWLEREAAREGWDDAAIRKNGRMLLGAMIGQVTVDLDLAVATHEENQLEAKRVVGNE